MAEPTTQSLADPTGTAGEDVEPAARVPAPSHPRHRRRGVRRILAGVGVVVLVGALGTTAVLSRHLWLTAEAWQDRAARYEQDAHGLGTDLANERADLAATRAELEAVRDQLGVAHERIIGLADEKAKLGDENEVQRRLVDYQARVSDAAGIVALALDQCVQGQQQLIAVMEVAASVPTPAPGPTPPPTPAPTPTPTTPSGPLPEEVAALRTEVDQLCQAATEANIDLQLELAQ